MAAQEEFVKIYTENIKREGSAELLAYLQSDKSDFFTAPSSTRFHGSHPCGLVEHSVNVYNCLQDFLSRPRCKELYGMGDYSKESITISALLHDLCKVNLYKESTRNVKENGVWVQKPYYEFDDKLPYGHGEKSVYIISSFMKLQRDEAFAIRWHMGFSNTDDKNSVGKTFEQFPLAFALHVSDMEASYYLEKSE